MPFTVSHAAAAGFFPRATREALLAAIIATALVLGAWNGSRVPAPPGFRGGERWVGRVAVVAMWVFGAQLIAYAAAARLAAAGRADLPG